MKKNILIICHNALESAPRFLMEVNALAGHYKLIGAGFKTKEIEDRSFEFVDLAYINEVKRKNITFHLSYPVIIRKPISLLIRLFFGGQDEKNKDAIQQFEFDKLNRIDADLIINHHLNSLPLAFKLAQKKNIKIIFNAHEYYPLEFEDNETWSKYTKPVYEKLAKQYLPKLAATFCVGDHIAQKYKEEFGIDSVIITNSKKFEQLPVNKIAESGRIRIIHHGAAIPSRKIELMIEMGPLLDERFCIDLMLTNNDKNYFSHLQALCQKTRNVKLINIVPMQDISRFINQYDIGLFLLPPVNFNYKYALPNKLFEFVQARLAIAISPSPEMKHMVEKYDLGIVGDDYTPASLAAKLNALTDEAILHYRQQCDKHAFELSSETSERLIKTTVDQLLLN